MPRHDRRCPATIQHTAPPSRSILAAAVALAILGACRPASLGGEPGGCAPRTCPASACGTVDDGCGGTIECGACTSPPAAPAGLAATAGDAQVTLSWSASAGATSYHVWQRAGAGSFGEVRQQAGTSWTSTGLTNGTQYSFYVTASNAAGTSAASSTASATPQAGAQPGNPYGSCTSLTLPARAQLVDTSHPRVVVGTGTAGSCTNAIGTNNERAIVVNSTLQGCP